MGVYRRGKEEDTEAILDFADMVFSMAAGSTDFEQLLPKAYSEKRRSVVMHHMIQEENGIRALIDVYPEMLTIGENRLKCAYIGTVCVHPKARGKGYMIELMRRVEESLRREGYDMMILDGNRHRYQHYGFEKAGMKYCFNVTSDSIRHACAALTRQEAECRGGMEHLEDISFELIEDADSALLDTIYALYQKRHVTLRDRESLYQCLKSWNADVYAVLCQGVCIGYLNTSADGCAIYELELADIHMLPVILYAYMTEMDVEELAWNVGMDETDRLSLLDGVSDYYSVSMSHQINILNYEHTLAFLLLWKKQYTNLEDARYVIGIEEQQQRTCYAIEVQGAAIKVIQTREPADVVFDRLSLVKELTTSYYYVAVQNENMALKKAPEGWFPLPFFLPEADAF